MKKKVISALLATAMVAAMVAGCGSDDKTAATPAATEGGETEAANDETEAPAGTEAQDVTEALDNAGVDLSTADVAVFYYTYSDAYISSVRTALDSKLDELGVKYTDYDSNNTQATQNEQIQTAIASGANVLVVNVVTSGTVDVSSQIVQMAKDADIPVIFFNRAVEDADNEGTVLGSYDKCAFVGTDAPEAGHMQGKMIGEYLVENFDAIDLNGDGKISYAMFMGEQGNVEAIARTQYGVEDANAVLTEAGKPELEYFDANNADKFQVDPNGAWSTQAAQEYMTTNLSQFNEESGNMIELVICNNDGMAEGAIAALAVKGYNTGEEGAKVIPVFGVDATDSAKALIADGKMTGTIMQDAQGMADCISDLVANAGSGQDVVANVDTERFVIAENVANKIYVPYGIYTGAAE
ncbi:galactose ABC transporter substrate-binding protein [Hominisplanchenecus murintestinalis]|jgi:methyl-galactoside transport system substrate-binding protein|uniref:Galactose ABC transporter substrate-binding protein n=1 Tax=Hominisplanchenecus murintestinalis TaxID=2941517 RepID=A0AC61R306_9FIRM|nr:galactose ABC transporter substrate-binding protein [Hominisplanchenecus murintestinalis]TGX99852.1 galactose ABC transporter substrate-binding protein [Hominisplanchenecus murintestinalis]